MRKIDSGTALRGPVPAQLLLAVSAGLGLGVLLALAGGPDAAWLAFASVALAAALMVAVPIAGSCTIPLGYAPLAALPALSGGASRAIPLAIMIVVAGVAARHGGAEAKSLALRLGAASVAATATVTLLTAAVDGTSVLQRVVVATVALVGADALVARWTAPNGTTMSLGRAAPVYLTLGCGAALLAVATDGFGVVMATAAAFPLLITRFAFERSAQAAETLRQTVQALGLVPELAGLVPLGHSERAAFYATAISQQVGLRLDQRERVVTATRLRHLGAVPFDPVDPDEPNDPEGTAHVVPERRQVAAQGALILREAGFPGRVADLVESGRSDGHDTASESLEAAVVWASVAFDDLIGEDQAASDRGLAFVSATARGPHDRHVAAALLQLSATRPTLVAEAVAAGARFREAASGLDLEALLDGGSSAEVLPFVRRRA